MPGSSEIAEDCRVIYFYLFSEIISNGYATQSIERIEVGARKFFE
jgi:hypothetical protein